MYISKVHIRNYRSISDLEIGINPKINICVGENGTGKTAFFDAIKNLIFKRDSPPEELPEYISIEICDNQKKLGQILYEFIKEQTRIPPQYISFFENAFLSLQEPLRVEFIGKKTNKKPLFYLKYKDIFFYDSHLVLDEECLTEHLASVDPQKIQPEKVRDAKTLSDFVKNVITKETPKMYIVRGGSTYYLSSEAFDFLQRNSFFVGEMRDLHKDNEKDAQFKRININKTEQSYVNFQNTTIDPTTFIDKLYNFQNTKSPTEYKVVKSFQQSCKDDGYEVDAIIDQHGKVVLRISEEGKDILLDNTSFPSGLLQKIFFNFVLAVSKDGLLFFEEPETNLHPGLQKHIFHLLKERNSQVFITTHSPEFVDNTLIKNIYKFQIDKQGTTQVRNANESDDSETFRKYFDVDKRIFFADFVILCEGNTEFVLFPYLFDEFTGKKEFLHEKNIFLANLGGKDQRKLYTKILKIFDIPYFIVLDDEKEKTTTGYDPESKTYRHKFRDFDKCYDDEYLKSKNIKKSGELKKNKLALKVLEYCLTHEEEKISNFLNDDAKKEFESMVKKHFMK